MRSDIIAIRRDDRFSPNSVDRDKAILKSVMDHLGGNIPMIDEARLTTNDEAKVYLSMGRLPQTTSLLKEKENAGALVLNSGYAVEACTRSWLDRLMRENGFPSAPLTGDNGYWIKRGDTAAQGKDDVVFCADEAELGNAKREFTRRGITDVVVSAHVLGDVIKFYGVSGGFFRYYYTTDEHYSKFGDEARNGVAHHYAFDEIELRDTVMRLAAMLRTDIYGGDVIVDPSGNISIIDFNDWPSFSRCRDNAAEAIARYVKSKYD